jgi:imidazole glycerol-phosphate synthase subunit HisH
MIGLIDSDACNLKAYVNLLSFLEMPHFIVRTPDAMEKASSLLLPGVGSFKGVMNGLNQRGLTESIASEVKSGKTLVGICAGMQALFGRSEESPGVEGLGLIAGDVSRIRPLNGISMNIGWRSLESCSINQFALPESRKVYFVHGYYCRPSENLDTIVYSKYGALDIPAFIRKSNVVGIQFHPEKSGTSCFPLLRGLL